MAKIQYNKFYKSPTTQITATWTICFLVGPLIGWSIGKSLGHIHLGLAIAETMSGLFTALILRKKLQLKAHHIILITLGWGVAALISLFVLFTFATLFPD